MFDMWGDMAWSASYSPLRKGGKTEYDNLIVLCPNCHTRVHKENTPKPKQLRHYKLKQEIAYELPILNKISQKEREFLAGIIQLSFSDQATFSKTFHYTIQTTEHDLATQQARKELCFVYLEASGMIITSVSHAILLANEREYDIVLEVRLTSKGLKWLNYLKETDMPDFFIVNNTHE